MLDAVNVAAACAFVTIPLLAGPRTAGRGGGPMAGCCFLIAFAFPFFALLETRVPPLITLAIVIGVAYGHALLYSVQAALIPELFSTRLRCTGKRRLATSSRRRWPAARALIAAYLIHTFRGHYWLLAAYIILIATISLACVWRLAETFQKDLRQGMFAPRPIRMTMVVESSNLEGPWRRV